MDLLTIISIISVYVAGASITFDRVGRSFDPSGDAVQVKVGCVVTVAAALFWPLAAPVALLYRGAPSATTRPKARRHHDHRAR